MASRSSADLASKTERGFENNPLKTKLLLDNDGDTTTGENEIRAKNNQQRQNGDNRTTILLKMEQP